MEQEHAAATTTNREDDEFPWSRSKLAPNQPFVMILTRNERRFDVCKDQGSMVNKFGSFAYEDIIGQKFGSEWVSRTAKHKQNKGNQRRTRKGGPAAKKIGDSGLLPGKEDVPLEKRGKVCVLNCTPELWCRALLHRTQIIYSLDFSLICFHLDLRPGSVVVESGTGSGSLSLAMARSVAPTGHVHTFEFNKSRVEAANKDFAMLFGEENYLITVREGDASEGFQQVDGLADAVFLDLPKPWLALRNCIRAMKSNAETRICCFSPCIEQVSRTCAEMRKIGGFHLIRTFEVVNREFETFRLQERVPDMWEEETMKMEELKEKFDPTLRSGNTSVAPTMATHTGYLTFASRFPNSNNATDVRV
ncbi:hypothetical protein BASA81_008370 [Batrachochytrium salamandrivorans]|nr:hypothetical protein BASA81_008370 [Batrachochytrium salamandrivorans]